MSETTPHQIRCDRCDQPMKWRRGRTFWRGDYEFSAYVYECQNACQVTATVRYKTFIPVDVARMQPHV